MKKTLGHAAGAAKLNKTNRITLSKSSAFLNSIAKPVPNKSSDVREFCRAYAVTQDTFTRLADFSARAVANWTRGQKPSASTERRLTELRRLFEELEKLVKPEAIGPWLKEPNPAFDGSTPVQVIERGETDLVWRMIYELQSGEPG